MNHRIIVEDDTSGSEEEILENGFEIQEHYSDNDNEPELNNNNELDHKNENYQERLTRYNFTQEKLFNLDLFEETGFVFKISKRCMVIKPNGPLLNLDNLLTIRINDRMDVLGNVFDVIGNIEDAYYVIIIDSYINEMIGESIIPGTKVYVYKNTLNIITEDDIKTMQMEKGTDLEFESRYSKEDEQYFSDDEKETNFQKNKNRKRLNNELLETQSLQNELQECMHMRIPSYFPDLKKRKF